MRKHLKYLRKEKGMTLVELLAVLVILGIVAAIAVPMISNVIENSRDKATVNEALNIINAAKLAYANNDFPEGVTNPKTETEFEYDLADLNGYLDQELKDQDFTVKFDKDTTTWSISNHTANDLVKNGMEETLKKYLDGDKTVRAGTGG